MRLIQLQNLETATRLIRLEMRISIIHSITGVNLKILRALYREVHGRSPVAGLIPSTGGILSSRAAQAMASVFAVLYRTIGGVTIFDGIRLDALLTAHELHLEFSQNNLPINSKIPPLNITQAWVITRDISIKAAYFRRCNTCHIDYLLTDELRLPPACPVCELKKRGAKC